MGMPFLPGGGGDDEDGEIPTLERRLRAAQLPAEAEEVVSRELRRLRRMSPMHSEYSTLVDYLEWMADLPWGPPAKGAQPPVPLSQAKAQLDADHFAMEKVRECV
jgi:ATP-dependent Lon protease